MEDSSKMDAAAMVAAEELQTLDKAAVELLSTWWAKHFQAAGHKRLGRALLGTRPKPCKTPKE